MIDVLLTLNNSLDSIVEYAGLSFNLINLYNGEKLKTKAYSPGNHYIKLNANNKKYITLPLPTYFTLDPWPSFEPGRYELEMSVDTKSGKVQSNKIEFEVLPINDEYKEYFNLLKCFSRFDY